MAIYAENTELKQDNVELKQEIAELRHRLNKNSQNSSKPPSSDGLKKLIRDRSLRKKGRKKSGSQEGHKGHTLRQVSKSDHIIFHDLSCCPGCKYDLNQTDIDAFVVRQVFDIPLPNLRELNALIEDEESWAKKISHWLLCSLRYKKLHKGKTIAADKLERLRASYTEIVKEGLAYHESLKPLIKKSKCGKAPKRKGHNLLLRLWNYCDDVLRFLTDPEIPFTN